MIAIPERPLKRGRSFLHGDGTKSGLSVFFGPGADKKTFPFSIFYATIDTIPVMYPFFGYTG